MRAAKYRLFLTCTCIVIGNAALFAQFNMKAAYRLVVTDLEEFDNIVATHVENFDVYEDGELVRAYGDAFGQLKVLHGFDLGIRQRFRNFALEGNWFNRRRQLQADGVRGNGNNFVNTISTVVNSASLGLQQHIGQFHLAGSIDYNFLSIKSKFEQPAFTRTVRDNAWGSTFSLGYTFKTRGIVTFSFQPYVQIYWQDFDLSELNETLNGPGSTGPNDQNFFNWGISLVIYNGYQD